MGRSVKWCRKGGSNCVIAARRTPFSFTFLSPDILDPSAYGFGNARVSSGKLCAGVAKTGFLGHTAHTLLSNQNFLLLLYLLHRESLVLELKKIS